MKRWFDKFMEWFFNLLASILIVMLVVSPAVIAYNIFDWLCGYMR